MGEKLPFTFFKDLLGTLYHYCQLKVIECAYSIPFDFPALFVLVSTSVTTDLTSDTPLWDSIASFLSDAVNNTMFFAYVEPILGFRGRDFSVADIIGRLRITKIVLTDIDARPFPISRKPCSLQDSLPWLRAFLHFVGRIWTNFQQSTIRGKNEERIFKFKLLFSFYAN